jgi:hypothetical protein
VVPGTGDEPGLGATSARFRLDKLGEFLFGFSRKLRLRMVRLTRFWADLQLLRDPVCVKVVETVFPRPA